MCGTERPGWHTIGRQTARDLYAIHRLAAPASDKRKSKKLPIELLNLFQLLRSAFHTYMMNTCNHFVSSFHMYFV